jgi:hypothetical protein
MTFVKTMLWIVLWMIVSFSWACLQKLIRQSDETIIQYWEQKIIEIPLYIP